MSSIDDIKSKIDIVDLVGEYVELRKAGVNFKGLCPFHSEKTPSFIVSREKQIWHCFGCGQGGDIFKFLMEKEGMDFGEAIRALAKKAGIQLSREDKKTSGERTRLLSVLDAAAKFYHQELLKSESALPPREYLKKRGLNAETVVKFSLGFASLDFDALLNHLQKTFNFKIDDIVKAGLVLKREKRAGETFALREHYDRFRQRIMFPIFDAWGHVVGFTGRILPEDDGRPNVGGKYVNTPTTEIYNKSRVLYGLNFAREAIKNQKLAVVVEGNMDVISSHQAGANNVVAASGTSLTGEQIQLLKRFTNNLVLAFDADVAGESAAMRGIEEALRQEMNVKLIIFPEVHGQPIAKDPDELISKSPDLWRQSISEAVPLVEYVYKKSAAGRDLKKIEDKKEIGKTLAEVIAKITNPLERAFWIQEIARRLSVSESALEQSVKNFEKKKETSKIFLPPANSRARREQLEERCLALAICSPNLCAKLLTDTSGDDFNLSPCRNFYQAVAVCYNNNLTDLSEPEIKDNLRLLGEDPSIFDVLHLLSTNEFFEFSLDQKERELARCIYELREIFAREARQKLIDDLRVAERDGNEVKILQLSKKLNELMSDGFFGNKRFNPYA